LHRARVGEHVALLNQYAADMTVVNQALLSGDAGRARALLEQYIPKPGQADLRGWEWNYFHSQANRDDALATLGRQVAVIWWASFSPDGHWLATADLKGELRLWDVRARALAAQTRQPGPISAIQFTADGRFLVSSSGGSGFSTNGAIHWLTVPDFREAREPMAISNLIQALPRPGGREWFVVGNGSFNRFATDGKTRLPAGSVPQKYPPAGFGVFSPDGSYFAYETGSASAPRLAVWNLTQDTARIFAGHQWREGYPYTITGLTFAPDDSAVVSCGLDGAVRVWPLQQESPNDSVRELRDIGGDVGQVAFALGGKLLAGGSTDETIHLWDAQTWNLVGQLRGSKSAVVALAVSPDGALVASGAMDGEVKLWSASLPRARQTVLPLPNYVFSTIDENLSLSPDGGYLLTRDKPKQAFQLWSTTTFKPRTNVPAPPAEYGYPSAVGPDGRWLAFLGKQGTRLIPRDISSGVTARTLTNAWIYRFSPDGRWLLGLDGSLTAYIYDAENGSELARASVTNEGPWRNAAFSGNGEWIAIAFHDGHVWAWNWRTNRTLKIDDGTGTLISDVAFSPDGKQLATVSYDSLTRVYDLATGRERYHITASSFELDSVAWSPDGHRLVIGSNDGLVRLWDLDTAPVREIAVLPGHTNAVEAVAFTPDGTLVTVSRDSLRVWRTDEAAR
jgi:WD40 repeat protein